MAKDPLEQLAEEIAERFAQPRYDGPITVHHVTTGRMEGRAASLAATWRVVERGNVLSAAVPAEGLTLDQMGELLDAVEAGGRTSPPHYQTAFTDREDALFRVLISPASQPCAPRGHASAK